MIVSSSQFFLHCTPASFLDKKNNVEDFCHRGTYV